MNLPTDSADEAEVQRTLWNVINLAYPADQLAGRFDNPASLDAPLPSIVRFQASATEQETWRGAFGAPNAREHVMAFVREIENFEEFPRAVEIRDFVDLDESGTINAVSQGALRELKQELRTRLGENNVIGIEHVRLIPTTIEKGKPRADVTTGHLGELCARAHAALKHIITRQMDEYWGTSDPTAVSPRELELECIEHQRFGQERAPADSFIGRERHLKAIKAYLQSDSRQPLVIHGASGCGKTALLARAAQDAAELKPVVRFIGVTPRASDIRSLLASLCREIRQRHPLESPISGDVPELTMELNEHLGAATAQEPLIMFLDALDQLADSDNGLSLFWIPFYQLPAHVKLIVSCLSARPPEAPASRPYSVLKSRRLPEDNFIDLDTLSEVEAQSLLFERWLPQARRRLTAEQAECIRERLKSDECRRPIYLKVLFQEARLWRSDTPVPTLGNNVSELLMALLKRLGDPSNHGETLAFALGYLAAARRGLTEIEILEVLYQDPDYMKFLAQITARAGHKLPDNPKRIPIAIWSRLRFDLEPYLTERDARGTMVLTFYHRQIGELARAKYLESVKNHWRPHERLADLFERKADPAQNLTWRTMSSHAMEELPYHLAQDANVPRWERTVCDPMFVEGACRAGLVFEFLRDVDDGLRRFPSVSVQLMRKAVASSLRTITKHPEFCLSILCNRLLWAEPNGLIAQAAARAAAALDTSGAWLQAASPLHAVESIPLDGRSLQAFIAEQQAFATADGSGNLEIRSTGRGELLAKRTLPSRTLTALAVEPAQFLAAWLDRNGDIRAEFSQSMLPGRAHETAVAYPRDDAVIAVSRGGDLVAWNPQLGETTVLAASIPCPLVALRANPDGSRILFVAGDRPSAQTLGIVSRSGRSWGTSKLRWNGRPVKHACLSPDGTRALLVDSGRGMSIVEVASGIVLASTQYERRSEVTAWGGTTACALGNARENEAAVIATDKGQVWAWDWKLDRFTGCGNFKGLQEGDAVHLLEILPEGGRIFLSTANRAAFFCTGGDRSGVPHSAAVADCAITESGLVGSVCREDRALKWWRFEGLAPLRSFPVEPPRVVAADGNDDCVFLGTDNGLLYRFPAARAPESKDIFRLFDHPVANIVSDRPGVAIAASTQGLIERVDFVADQAEWLCSQTSGQRQRSLLPRMPATYIAIRESEISGRGDVVALGTGQNIESEIYKSSHSAVLVAASREGKHLVIHDRSLKVFKLDGGTLTPLFTAEANRSICAMQLLLGDKYLLLAQRDEPWLELRRLEPGVPVAAVLELPSAPSCLCARLDKIAIGFRSGDLLCVRVRDASRAKPIVIL